MITTVHNVVRLYGMPSKWCCTQFLMIVTMIITTTATIQDDFAIVRENVRKIMLWPTSDQLPAILTQAAGNLSNLDRITCQWPDLNYTTRGPENWDPVLHMFRISTMTAALTAPGVDRTRLAESKLVVECHTRSIDCLGYYADHGCGTNEFRRSDCYYQHVISCQLVDQ